MITIDNYLDNHFIHRSNWLRLVVLGMNAPALSVSSLAIVMAAASITRRPTVQGLMKYFLYGFPLLVPPVLGVVSANTGGASHCESSNPGDYCHEPLCSHELSFRY